MEDDSGSFSKQFGALVRERRASMGLTMAELAELSFGSELRKSQISRIERGIVKPHARTIDAISSALGIPASEIQQLKEPNNPLAEGLRRLKHLSRDQLETLALRFGIEGIPSLGESALRELLERKAEEYSSYKAQIDALDERVTAIASLKGAAQDSAAKLDFDNVEELLARVDEVETTIAAETKEARAINALLRNRPDQAHKIFAGAAEAFSSVDMLEEARRRNRYQEQLRAHGLRYGGTGIARAIEIIRPAIAVLQDTGHKTEWAAYQNDLAVALRSQGTRTAGPEGAALLAEAVAAHCAALTVYSEADHPVDWAKTQMNLGTTFGRQGSRTAGPEGAALLTEAVAAYRAALRVYTEFDHPVDWAMTQMNLGNTLGNQSTRTAGPEGTALLAEAVAAYRAALTVLTEADHPVELARTQTNLGNALADQGTRTAGPEGASLLAEAVAAFRAALTVTTEVDYPVDWAWTQTNLGITLAHQGTRTAEPEGAGADLSAEAVAAYRAALTVYSEADHPVDWARTQMYLGIALRNQGSRTAGPQGAALLAEAVAAHRAALIVRTKADHPVDWARTQMNLGNALADQGTRTAGPVGAALLSEAVAAYRAALSIRTEADHPVDWALTQDNLARTEEDIADHDTTADPRPHLEAALGHVEAALRVFDPEHMSYDHDRATRLRDDLKARLDALE